MDAYFTNAKAPSEWKGSDSKNRDQVQAASWRRECCGGNHVAAVRPLRVLIVDANRDAADTMSMLVQLWGHDARCAYDGAAGLAMAAATMPDVVLLDIAMPRMDGCQLAVRLRHKAGLKDCLLIAVTGYADEKHRRRGQEAGIDVFLVKPVEAVVMETLLLLERRRLRTLQAVDAESNNFGVVQ
ncbi:MAG TPA: response regulator [Pirellulaceae bacterium]|nr:response regulator [Pirellulaceae bacterium]